MITPLSKLPHFDPVQMPVLGTGADLPAVPESRLTAAGLRARFEQTGLEWEPEVRQEPRFTDRQPAEAAVLIALVMRPQGLTVLLTERTAHLSTHSGQVAFPGGKRDPEDLDAAATALREAEEEVGLDASWAEVIGHLPQYITGTAFTITPIVALVRPGFTLRLNADEVADAFEVPLAFLMDPANHRNHALQVDDMKREWFSMPWDDQGRLRFIWGATAGMLRNLYRLLSA